VRHGVYRVITTSSSHSIAFGLSLKVTMRLLSQVKKARIQRYHWYAFDALRDIRPVRSGDREKRVNDHLGLDHLL